MQEATCARAVEQVQIVLDLEVSAGRPSGVVRASDGRVIPFSGWLELMDGVERALISPAGGGTARLDIRSTRIRVPYR